MTFWMGVPGSSNVLDVDFFSEDAEGFSIGFAIQSIERECEVLSYDKNGFAVKPTGRWREVRDKAIVREWDDDNGLGFQPERILGSVPELSISL